MVVLQISGSLLGTRTDPCIAASYPELYPLPTNGAWTHSNSSLASVASTQRRLSSPATADQGSPSCPTHPCRHGRPAAHQHGGLRHPFEGPRRLRQLARWTRACWSAPSQSRRSNAARPTSATASGLEACCQTSSARTDPGASAGPARNIGTYCDDPTAREVHGISNRMFSKWRGSSFRRALQALVRLHRHRMQTPDANLDTLATGLIV